jgi:hypothetical protein
MQTKKARCQGLPATARPATIVTATCGTVARSASEAGRRSLCHRACFIYYKRSTQEVLSVASIDRSVGVVIVYDFNEPEPTGLAGKAILDYADRLRLETGLVEPLFQLTFGRLIWQIAYE